MTVLETTANIPDDRLLVLQLPDEVSPGEHRVRIEIDSRIETDQLQEEITPVKWDGKVLVYGGEGVFTGDICQIIDDDREDRLRKIWGGMLQ